MPTNESPPEIKTDEVANDAGRALLTLQEVLASLLAPDGCPWDKEQTPESLCEYLIEETHELVDAVRNGTPADVRGELGDVFFLLIFVAALLNSSRSLVNVILAPHFLDSSCDNCSANGSTVLSKKALKTSSL